MKWVKLIGGAQVLEELAALHPFPRLLQEHRTLSKLLSDFVSSFEKKARRASVASPGVVRMAEWVLRFRVSNLTRGPRQCARPVGLGICCIVNVLGKG